MVNTRQKGRKLVKQIIDIFRNEIDPATYEVVGSGAGKDKGDIRCPKHDLVIEAKNCQTLNIGKWTEQAEREGLNSSKTALMWRHPKSPQENPDIRVDISLEYFIKLLNKNTEQYDSREKKWAIENLKRAIQKVQNML